MKTKFKISYKFLAFYVGPLLIFAAYTLPNIVIKIWGFDTLKKDAGGQIGDLYGGLNAPIIGVLGILLTFMAFYIQYEANLEQKKQFDQQAKDLKTERFENVFFEMIRLHRENVSELSLAVYEGRRVFIALLKELRELRNILKDIDIKNTFTNIEISEIAFIGFLYGVGPNSTRILKSNLEHMTSTYEKQIIILKLIKHMEKSVEIQHNLKSKGKLKKAFIYYEGHQSRLAHYYRHFYETIRYIEKYANNEDDGIELSSLKYINILLAQMSNHELALLAYLALGTDENSKKYKELLIRHSLLKGLPKDFIDKDNEFNVNIQFQ